MEENKFIYKIYHGDEYIASFVYLHDALSFIKSLDADEYAESYWRYTIVRTDDY